MEGHWSLLPLESWLGRPRRNRRACREGVRIWLSQDHAHVHTAYTHIHTRHTRVHIAYTHMHTTHTHVHNICTPHTHIHTAYTRTHTAHNMYTHAHHTHVYTQHIHTCMPHTPCGGTKQAERRRLRPGGLSGPRGRLRGCLRQGLGQGWCCNMVVSRLSFFMSFWSWLITSSDFPFQCLPSCSCPSPLAGREVLQNPGP